MLFPAQMERRLVKDTGLVALSGAAGTTVAGGSLPRNEVETGSLAAFVRTKLGTASLTGTIRWQASDDGTNWFDVVLANNPANVAVATAADSSRYIVAPVGMPGRFFRAAFTTSGATAVGGSTDQYRIYYEYRLPRF